jgi:arsenate reductase-like glutaredoxin family protein
MLTPVEKNDLKSKLALRPNMYGQRRFFEKWLTQKERSAIEEREGSSIGEKIYGFVNDVEELPRCVCGKPVRFKSFKEGYLHYCSVSCKARSQPHTKEQYEKMSKTLKNTMMTLYGVSNCFQLESVKAKIKEKKEAKAQKVRARKHSPRVKAAYLPKLENPEVENLIKEANKNRKDLETLRISRVLEDSNLELLDVSFGKYSTIRAMARCKTCGSEFEVSGKQRSFRCRTCDPLHSVSKSEIRLRKTIEEICDLDMIYNDKSLIKPYEIDILIPDLKLGIEYNGTYWHKFRDHTIKPLLMKERGYRLIQVFEFLETTESFKKNFRYVVTKQGSYTESVEWTDGSYFYHRNSWPILGPNEVVEVFPPKRYLLNDIFKRTNLGDDWIEDCGITVLKLMSSP